MSTYVYLRCLDHDPTIRASGESGQHLSDLPQLRADLANRETLVKTWDLLDFPDFGGFRNATVSFMAGHPRCHLGIIDEYGVEHSLTDD